MEKLDYWLQSKEMYGIFNLDSITVREGMLKAVVTNEVFKLTISFPGGLQSCQITEAVRKADWLEALRAEHSALMQGNTFFKLPAANSQTRYVIAAPNYVAEFVAGALPSVALEQAARR